MEDSHSRRHNPIIAFITLIVLSVASSTLVHAASTPHSTLTFSNIITAQSAGAQEAMVVGGGRWLTQRKLVHSAVLVKHPQGTFLWDSGIGSEVEAQMRAFSFLDRQLFKIEDVNPAAKQLKENNFSIDNLMAIVPSHMHWDHVSGIEDFIGVPVWVRKAEHDGAKQGKPPAFVRSQFDSEYLQWKHISLPDGPYKGFEQSWDLFKDGSVVFVDLYGHTQGQLGMFLNTAKGTYFFIGDTSWAIEGINNNVGRPKILNWAMGIDFDIEKNNEQIHKIHKLSQEDPNLTVVPAHDENVTAELPIYPEFL